MRISRNGNLTIKIPRGLTIHLGNTDWSSDSGDDKSYSRLSTNQWNHATLQEALETMLVSF